MTNSITLRRLFATELLAANTMAGRDVYEFADWPSTSENMPQILVYDAEEEAHSEARGQPNFTTVSYLKVDGRVKAETAKGARELLDQMHMQILQAVVINYDILKVLQQIKSIHTQKKMNSETGMHVGQIIIAFGLEYFQAEEDFDTLSDAAFAGTSTSPPVDLKEVDINVDLINRFDANGNYPGAPFPGSVTPAPRTEGPDGRNEAFVKINTEE